MNAHHRSQRNALAVFLLTAATLMLAGCGNTAAPSADTGVTTGQGSNTDSQPQATAPQVSTPVVDLQAIANKSESVVASILGPPDSKTSIRNKGRSYPQRIYRNGTLEIVFVNGQADWITVYGNGQLPFSTAVLAALGLPSTSPTFSNPSAVIRWNNIPGLREVSVFPSSGDRADYAYVLVNTAP